MASHRKLPAPPYAAVNRVALRYLPILLGHWLPDGCREGREWVARNPRCVDHRPGSFKVNMATGKWADFATGQGGGDIVSLAAYLESVSQPEACRGLARLLGVGDGR